MIGNKTPLLLDHYDRILAEELGQAEYVPKVLN
jgi:hypothetical protein